MAKQSYSREDMKALTVICNGCGQAMLSHGEWPQPWPKGPDLKTGQNIQQVFVYWCGNCRTPHPDYKAGIPVRVSIVEEP